MDGDLDIEKAADALIELGAVLDCSVSEITDLLLGDLLSAEEINKIHWLTNPDE